MHDGGFTSNHLSRWEYPDFWHRRFVPRAMVVVGSERSPLGERQRGGGPPKLFQFVCTPHVFLHLSISTSILRPILEQNSMAFSHSPRPGIEPGSSA